MINSNFNKAKQWLLQTSKDKTVVRFNPYMVAKELNIPKEIFLEACIETEAKGIIIAEFCYSCNCNNYIICECLDDIPEKCKDCGKEIDLHKVFVLFKFIHK